MLNGDADATRHQCQHQSLDDAEVWDGVFQITEALGENVEQQRHHTQRCEAGASGQYDAVNVSDKKMYTNCALNKGRFRKYRNTV